MTTTASVGEYPIAGQIELVQDAGSHVNGSDAAPGLGWPRLVTLTDHLPPGSLDSDSSLGKVYVARSQGRGLTPAGTAGDQELHERLPVLGHLPEQESKLVVGQKHHFGGLVSAQSVAITRVGRDVPGSHRRIEGTGQEAMFVGRGLGGSGQAVEPLGRIGVGQCRQWQGPDLAGGNVVGDVAPVPNAGCLIDPRQVVHMVGAPAGHREAIGSGRVGCPDFQRLGWACFVSQLLEPQGLGMVIKRCRSLPCR